VTRYRTWTGVGRHRGSAIAGLARALRALWCADCGAYIEHPVLSEPCPKCGK
jgi:Zn finger protein HypA/HybF involved in hydrogenase expression